MAGKSLKKRGIALALSVILAGGGVGALIPSYEAEAEEAVYGTEAEAPSFTRRRRRMNPNLWRTAMLRNPRSIRSQQSTG